jgi:hypothetical protein
MRPFEDFWAYFYLELEDDVINIGHEPGLDNEPPLRPASIMADKANASGENEFELVSHIRTEFIRSRSKWITATFAFT